VGTAPVVVVVVDELDQRDIQHIHEEPVVVEIVEHEHNQRLLLLLLLLHLHSWGRIDRILVPAWGMTGKGLALVIRGPWYNPYLTNDRARLANYTVVTEAGDERMRGSDLTERVLGIDGIDETTYPLFIPILLFHSNRCRPRFKQTRSIGRTSLSSFLSQ
jgi:hypothetical protein